MGTWREPQRSIKEVVERDSWVRRTLREHNIHPNPEEWHGVSGTDVAASLLAKVSEVEMTDGSAAAERREEVIGRCGRAVGFVAIPAAAEIA